MLTRSQAARLNVKQDTKRVSIKPKKRGQPYFCSCTRKGTKRKMIKEEKKKETNLMALKGIKIKQRTKLCCNMLQLHGSELN